MRVSELWCTFTFFKASFYGRNDITYELGGGVKLKVYVFFRGGSQKCTFVDKGEGGFKNAQKLCAVRLLWMAPNVNNYP